MIKAKFIGFMGYMMFEKWAYKWLDQAKTRVMFCNPYVSSNVIFSLEDLRAAVIDNNKPFRLVPLSVLKKALQLRELGPLSDRFKRAI